MAVVAVNKMDLAEVMEFNKEYFLSGVRSLDPAIPVLFLSARTGQGMDEAVAWIRKAILA